MSRVAHKPAGRPDGGQFAGVAHAEGVVQLTAPSGADPRAEWLLERAVVEAVYTAGRGFGRNRFGNPELIQEAYDASAAYLAALGTPRSVAELEARAAYVELCAAFQVEKDGLDEKQRRTRQFEAARQANWIIEYRAQAQSPEQRADRIGATQ